MPDPAIKLGIEAAGWWPWAIAAAAALALAVVWLLAFRSRLRMSGIRRWLLAGSRTLLLLILAAALLEPALTRFERRLEVAFLVDASASVPEDQVGRARDFLSAAYQGRGDAKGRVLTFAQGPEVVPEDLSPASFERPASIMSTDIARAVHAALDLLPRDATRRIVLLTDGNQTQGDLLEEARVAAGQGVEIYAVPLETLGLMDAYVESLSLPRSARPGERIKVRAKVISNFAAPAEVLLSAGGRTQRRRVDLLIGENWVDFEFNAGPAGDHGVAGEIKSDADQVPQNNRLAGTLRVVARPRAAFVTEDLGKDAATLAALEAEGFDLSVVDSGRLPGGLGSFDLVILSSLSFEKFGGREADALDEYMRKTGGGLLLLAGEESQGLGEEEENPIEPLLPVKFKLKKKTEPNPVEMVILIDKSASMARQNKFGLALAAVERLLDALPKRSRVCVILFDDLPYRLFPLTDIEEREKIREALYKLGTDGGTSIYPPMRKAYDELKDSEARVKHVILLTDGISTTKFEQNGDIVEALARRDITVSTVAVGKESDRDHLRTIAQAGNGRFYYIEDPASIPDIFIEETKTITRTNIVEDRFRPELLHPGEMFSGMGLGELPELTGYNSSDPRPTSETYMIAREREPLLARWSVGLGKATVFCADLRGEWSRDWLEWDEFHRVVGRIARHTMRDRNLQNFDVAAAQDGDVVRITVDATDAYGNFINEAPLDATVTRPDLGEERVELVQDRPGGYSGSFPLSGFGGYTIKVVPAAGPLRSEGIGRVQLEPPGEFLRTQADVGLLRAAAEATGGVFDPKPAQAFAPSEEFFPRIEQLWPYFMYAAFGAVLLGVLIRRI